MSQGIIDQERDQLEDAVLAMLRDQHPDAAQRLIEVFGDRVYGLTLRMLGSEQDAQEAVQETFLTVWRKHESFREQARFSSWIYRVAANQALMQLRKRRRSGGAISLDQLESHGEGVGEPLLAQAWVNALLVPMPSPDADIQHRELAALIQDAVKSLSPSYRTAYMLKEIEGLPLRAIAEILQVSEATVKTRVHRARLQLRKLLAPHLRA